MPLTICPVAIAVGCRKCPVFRICPVKSVIGDQPSARAAPPATDAPTVRAKRKKRSSSKRGARGR